MKVIRRELPRTRVAGPGREALSHSCLEDPPLRRPLGRWPLGSIRFSQLLPFSRSLCRRPPARGFGLKPLLDFHPYGPDESQQFPADGRDHVLLRLAPGVELSIATVEAVLGLPGDLLDFLALSLLPLAQRGADRWPVSVGPGCLYDDPSEVGVACLRDGPTPGLAAPWNARSGRCRSSP